jgi:threonylcarbamoyladenosine tRNA methylthiotransferase MtaB
MAVIEETCMLDAHVFRYSPRADTPAAELAGRVSDVVARRRSAEARRAAAKSGHARRARAVGSRQQVIWDRVENGIAHGVTATYLEVITAETAPTRVGAVSTVAVDAVDGGALRGRLVTP